jgi:cytidyltransferase-like protein
MYISLYVFAREFLKLIVNFKIIRCIYYLKKYLIMVSDFFLYLCSNKIMIKVMVFGTFDSLHRGHIFFLKEALKRGDYLTAVTARDKTVDELKGRSPLHNYGKREKKLMATGLVDQVIPSDKERGSWEVIEREKPHIICLGHDQIAMRESLENWIQLQKDYKPHIEMLPPYKRIFFSTTAHRKRREAGFYILLFTAMLLMAFSWISGKYVSVQAPFSVLIFWRLFLSFLPFLFFVPKSDLFKLPIRAWLFTGLSSILIILYNIFFFLGLKAGLAGKGGVMVTTLNPLITTTIIHIIHKKRPRPIIIASLILGSMGGFFFMEPWTLGSARFFTRGNLLFLVAALCWALLTICSSQALKMVKLSRYNFFLYLSATLISLFIALPDHPFNFQLLSLSFWINIVYLSLFVTSLATSLYFKAAQKLGPSRASAFTFVIPLMALFLSWIFLNEIPLWPTLAGGILSLVGLYLNNIYREKI